MTVFDWLEGVALPTGQTAFDVVEVRFKANRKGFFQTFRRIGCSSGRCHCG